MPILIVDDDDIALDTLRHALTLAGHETVTAHDGHEALKILGSGACRLVVSDWVMPGMDGVELCRQIRGNDFGNYVYLILVTSRDSKKDIVEGLSAGADDFLIKPFHPDELRVRVRTGERILALETREVAIFAMAKLVESRHPETGRHLERMRNYCRIIARHLISCTACCGAVDEEYVRLIYLTSPLHDIGKIGIPDSILFKPGRLTEGEFEVMKTHTTIGAETLGAAARRHPGVRYLHIARNIALTHHERFDGTGYPAGLSGPRIPLCGRIVALADVYDALTTSRAYKCAYKHETARSMILDEAGAHFDPMIVDSFLQNEERFVETLRNFAEPGLHLVGS